MAVRHARGELGLNADFVNESFIGTSFTGRLVEETSVGSHPAVVPTITGRSWLTGTAQYTLDPTDPFPAGFTICRELHALKRPRGDGSRRKHS